MDDILIYIQNLLPFNDWKNFRLVCKDWHLSTYYRFRNEVTYIPIQLKILNSDSITSTINIKTLDKYKEIIGDREIDLKYVDIFEKHTILPTRITNHIRIDCIGLNSSFRRHLQIAVNEVHTFRIIFPKYYLLK